MAPDRGLGPRASASCVSRHESLPTTARTVPCSTPFDAIRCPGRGARLSGSTNYCRWREFRPKWRDIVVEDLTREASGRSLSTPPTLQGAPQRASGVDLFLCRCLCPTAQIAQARWIDGRRARGTGPTPPTTGWTSAGSRASDSRRGTRTYAPDRRGHVTRFEHSEIWSDPEDSAYDSRRKGEQQCR